MAGEIKSPDDIQRTIQEKTRERLGTGQVPLKLVDPDDPPYKPKITGSDNKGDGWEDQLNQLVSQAQEEADPGEDDISDLDDGIEDDIAALESGLEDEDVEE